MKSDVVLLAQDLTRRYQQGDRQVEVLNGLSLTVSRGETVAIVGVSGSRW